MFTTNCFTTASRQMKRAALLVATVSLLFPVIAGAQLLTETDPLRSPAPDLDAFTFVTAKSANPLAKVSPALLLKAGEGVGDVRVIVTLHEPTMTKAAEAEFGSPDELERVRTAATAHKFMNEAAALGFTNEIGLSHMPIVIGDFDAARVIELAELGLVKTIESNVVQHAYDFESRQLTRSNKLNSTKGAKGQGIRIAIVDTGVDFDHVQYDMEAGWSYDGNAFVDPYGHGTKVLASAGAAAPRAKYYNIRAGDANGKFDSTNVVRALNVIYANLAEHPIRIVNLSFGSGLYNSSCNGQFPAYAKAISKLHSKGITIFAATGNDFKSNGIASPACIQQTISVGAVFDAKVGDLDVCSGPGGADQVTCYSNVGNPLDIYAPGTCLRVKGVGGKWDQCFSGTSAASPFAAGVAAQLLSKINVGPEKIRQAMRNSGKPIFESISGLTRSRVDALAAFQHLQNGGGGNGGGGNGGGSPGGGGNGGTARCSTNATTKCLHNNRFEIRAAFRTANNQGFLKLQRHSDTTVLGSFNDPKNVEVLGKVLNGCSVNGYFWVYLGGVTDQGIGFRIRDTRTGRVVEYENKLGTAFKTGVSTRAFPCS